jgi:hypothetical protein
VILTFSTADVSPDRSAVFENLGIPPDTVVPEHIEGLYGAAAKVLAETVTPVGVLADISKSDFGIVYRGEGRNEPQSPVADIFERAEHLALFAATLGGQTSEAIGGCFESQDFALACVLDAMASAAADKTAELAEQRFGEMLRERGWTTPDGAALRYSPGYCGWDITSQKKLFEYLQPQQIDVTLTDSCLMQPLKSVSGAIIAGPRTIHQFPPSYSFCTRCETHSCRARLRALPRG